MTDSPPPKELVPKKPEEVFAEALEEAGRLSDAADKTEPEETRKALALLTQEELLTSRAYMIKNGTATNLNVLPPDTPAIFNRIGLSAWVSRQSRKVAKGDTDFKKVAPALWEPKSGPAGLFAMMNVWGTIQQPFLLFTVRAIEMDARADQLLPEVRNAILDLGGRAWLQR